MTDDDETDMATQLRAKAVWHAEQAERYRIAAEVLEGEAKSQRGRSGGGRNSSSRSASSTTTMVLKVLEAASERRFTVDEAVPEMLAAGWDGAVGDQINTVRTALSRLASSGKIRRVEQGVYQALAADNIIAGVQPKPTEAILGTPDPRQNVAAETDPWDQPPDDPWSTPAPSASRGEPPF